MSNWSQLEEQLLGLDGAAGTLWGYSVSHQTLTLRLEDPRREGNIHLICRGCRRIEVASSWHGSKLRVSQLDASFVLLRDAGSNLRVECRLIHLEKDVAPVY